MNYCSKPRCSSPGTVLLGFDYAARTASLDILGDEPPSPHLYVVCADCADNLTAPRGWQVVDRRVVVLNDWVHEVAGLRGSSELSGLGPVQIA